MYSITRIKSRYLKDMIFQINSKNEWLLLTASFTATFGLALVLRPENFFLNVSFLKPPKKAYVLLKNSARDFQNSPPIKRSSCFNVTFSGQNFNFKTNFQENENIFQKV